MANFDIINAAGRAYQTSWAERRYLLRLAAVPFFLNVACMVVVFAAGYQLDPIRKTLCMVPALLAEGWMLSHYVRLIILDHRWPFKGTGNMDVDVPALRTRARGVLGGAIVYVLINMASYAVLFVLMTLMKDTMPDPAQPAPALPVIAGFVSSFALLWLFRLFWIYIPYAVNIDAKTYLIVLRGMFSSLPMFGVFLMCFIPFLILHIVVGGVMHSVLIAVAGENIAGLVLVITGVFFSMVASLVATAGMAYGLRDVFDKTKGAKV